MIRLGVAGTDTGVGKTTVSCAIAAALTSRGSRVGVMKPAETGVTRDNHGDDASLLTRAAASTDNLAVVRPYAFPAPIAPLAAARLEHSEIELPVLDRAFAAICVQRDTVIVEGAGGLLVPLAPDTTYATLFARWNLGLVIVAANRLGVVNHTLLTLRAAEAAGLSVVAVVLNDIVDVAVDASVSGNQQLIREFAPSVRVIRFPSVPHISDHQALARAAMESGLIDTIAAHVRTIVNTKYETQ